jgi:hypothetical protein
MNTISIIATTANINKIPIISWLFILNPFSPEKDYCNLLRTITITVIIVIADNTIGSAIHTHDTGFG